MPVLAAGVLPSPLNNEVPLLGCSAGLLKLNRLPPDAGCDDAAGAVDVGGAGVVDWEAAGVPDAG